jgi:TonB family protein
VSSRELNTPLVLWVCAAVCAHFVLGEGGEQVALFHDDGVALAELGQHVRGRVRDRESAFDVSTVDEMKQVSPPPPPPDVPKPPPPKPPPLAKREPPKPEPPKPPPPPEKKVAVLPKPQADQKEPLPVPKVDHRIAVQQHAKPDQKDNPNARFLANDANHVDQESVATLTSHDQDDPNPTPGAYHAGDKSNVGDSDKTKIADSDQHAGEKDRGPGERGTEFEIQHDPMPTKPVGASAVPGAAGSQAMSGGDGRQAGAPTPQESGSEGQVSPGSAVIIDANGNWIFNPVKQGSGAPEGAQAQGSGKKAGAAVASTTWLGLGGKAGPGQVNLNLNERSLVAAVGQDELTREREADGERRLSEHRGSWTASSFERWRSAIENYVSSVKPGNQTALNAAKSPFATYLVGMHNRIHPIFAESFLGSLDSLPKNHPMNDPKIYTTLEIILAPNGHVVKMGVVKTSGFTAFDIAALDSVQRASPFGPAPSSIVSPDGRVYLHWQFHREAGIACSTLNTTPVILNVPAAPPQLGPPPVPENQGVPPTQERGAPPPTNINETREGAVDVRRSTAPT